MSHYEFAFKVFAVFFHKTDKTYITLSHGLFFYSLVFMIMNCGNSVKGLPMHGNNWLKVPLYTVLLGLKET